jgi:hypothetical protein
VRCCAGEINRGARIHDRENGIALGNEPLERADIRQSGLAREQRLRSLRRSSAVQTFKPRTLS